MVFVERYLQSRSEFAELMKHYPFTTETLPGEVWASIEGFDRYQVSNYGRVKSLWLRDACVIKKPKILKPNLDRSGYLVCRIRKKENTIYFRVHRLVAQAFLPNPDNKPQVNHIDGCKWNSCLSNLEWATREENMQHADTTGLRKMPQGEDVYNSKFTEKDILYIRNNPDGLNNCQLAIQFDVNNATISGIRRGKTYSNVGGVISRKRLKYGHRLPLAEREKIYLLYQEGGITHEQLGEMFGITPSRIGQIIRENDKAVGRKINYHSRFRVPDDIKKKIRAEYQKGVIGHGATALAKKYGYSPRTVQKIVNEK